LGHRYFLCAQQQAKNSTSAALGRVPRRGSAEGDLHNGSDGVGGTVSAWPSGAGASVSGGASGGASARTAWNPPSYRESKQWLDFQFCSYGQCQECDVFTELFCLTPCKTYTSFTKPVKHLWFFTKPVK
jgi:hypothetical protein